MNSVLEGEAWLIFVLCVDNEQRKENEFWLDQFIWCQVVDSETAGLELMMKSLVFARQQITLMNQEGYNEILNQLQGPGTICCTFICKLPCIFDLK